MEAALKILYFLLIVSLTPHLLAQRVVLKGQPLSVHLVDSQGFDAPMYLAIVLWDGERKVLVSGASRNREVMAQVMALIQSEINDGDDEPIAVECTRRVISGDGGQTRFPTARHEIITSLEVERHLFKGNCWSNL